MRNNNLKFSDDNLYHEDSSLVQTILNLFARMVRWKTASNLLAFEHTLYRYDESALRSLLDTLQSGATIVDIGCGDGRYWELRPDLDWLGLDVKRTSKASIVIEQGQPLPLGDESVDAVLLRFSLEHVADLSLMKNEISRVVKKGGRILLTFPFLYPLHDTPEDFWRISSEGIRVLFDGLIIEKSYSPSGYFEVSATLKNYFIVKSIEERYQAKVQVSSAKRFVYLIFICLLIPPALFFILLNNLYALTMRRNDHTGKFEGLIYIQLKKMRKED
jgi:SAM-dependent methyltransferase